MIFENAIIIKATAGFYYVKTLDGDILECKARGVFRKQGLSPLVGDRATAEIDGERGTVTDIYERKNSFLRPPVANVDKLIIVSSTVEPRPNLLLIDRLTAIAVSKNVEPIVVFSKTDLAPCHEYCKIYEKAGIKCIPFSSETNEGADKVKKLFENSVCALTGNTGVGKSSLLNTIAPDLSIETSHISKKLGRGRHTTRTVELYVLFCVFF